MVIYISIVTETRRLYLYMPRKSNPIKYRSLDVGIQLVGGHSPFTTFTAVIISAKDSQRDIVLSKLVHYLV